MDVLLDNQSLPTEERVLGRILEAARQQLRNTGRIIVEVRVNGEAIDAESLDQLFEQQPPDAQRIELLSADPRDLSLQTFRDVRAGLEEARRAQQQATEHLNADDTAGAMEHVRTVLNRWQEAQQAVRDSAALLGLHLDDLTIGDRPLIDVVNELADILSRTREQLMASDWIGLADTLGYELDDAAALWMDLLDTLADHVETNRDQPGTPNPPTDPDAPPPGS